MNVNEERVRVTFADMTRTNVLFELKPDGAVVATEDGRLPHRVGRIPENGGPLERDFHWWCAAYIHTCYQGVLMTESTVEV